MTMTRLHSISLRTIDLYPSSPPRQGSPNLQTPTSPERPVSLALPADIFESPYEAAKKAESRPDQTRPKRPLYSRRSSSLKRLNLAAAKSTYVSNLLRDETDDSCLDSTI